MGWRHNEDGLQTLTVDSVPWLPPLSPLLQSWEASYIGVLASAEGVLSEALQAGTPAAYRRPGRKESPVDPEAYRGQESRAVRQVAACRSAGDPCTRRAGLGGCNTAREVPSHTAAEDKSRSRGSHTAAAAVGACRRDSMRRAGGTDSSRPRGKWRQGTLPRYRYRSVEFRSEVS